MHWQHVPYVVPLLASAAVALVLAIYAFRYRAVPGAVPLTIAALATVLWCVAYAFEETQPELSSKIFWINVQYFSLTGLPVAWLAMTLQYTGLDHWLRRRHLIWLCLIPAITLALIWTNDRHGLIHQAVYLDIAGPFPVVGKEYGPWFWVHVAYSYLLLLISLSLLIERLLHARPIHRWQCLALFIGLLMPFLGNASYVLYLKSISHIDPTPVILGLSALVIGWALFRFRLFDVVPVAHDKVFEGMRDGTIVLNDQGQVVDLNPAAQGMLGRTYSQVVGRQAVEVFQRWPELLELCRGSETRTQLVLTAVETERHYEAQISALAGHRHARPLGQVLTLRDITERVNAERALQAANERLTGWVGDLELRNRESGLLNEMGDRLQTCLTVEEAYGVVARAAGRLFPDDAGALFALDTTANVLKPVATWGEAPSLLVEHTPQPSECWTLRSGQQAFLADNAEAALLCEYWHPALPASSLCVPMMAQSDTPAILHFCLSAPGVDQSNRSGERSIERKQRLAVTVAETAALALTNLQLRQALREQAIRDPLTSLFNRRYMEETLGRELARAARRHSPVGIVMLDIDRFKQSNDLHGHQAGDAVLRSLGGYLRAHLREEDIACRYGGEEFVLILPDASLEASHRAAERLRAGIGRLTVQIRGQAVGPVSVSMGVAAYPQHGRSGEDLLKAADEALYQAKAAGRDRVHLAAEPV